MEKTPHIIFIGLEFMARPPLWWWVMTELVVTADGDLVDPSQSPAGGVSLAVPGRPGYGKDPAAVL